MARRDASGMLRSFVAHFTLIILAFMCLFFFYILIINSTCSHAELQKGFSALPKSNLIKNFKAVTNDGTFPMTSGILNSVIVSSLCAAICTYFSALTAYGLYVYDFKLKKVMFTIILAIMMIPTQVTALGSLKLVRDMKLMNSFIPLIVPAIAAPVTFFYIKQYMESSLPMELLEAARIDGLPEWKIFFKMYVPIQKSIYAAAAVITFMNAWNAYMWPKVVMSDNRAQTMPMFIANISSGYTVDYGMTMLGVLFCSVPTMFVFFVLQKQFAEGITGSVK